LREVHVAEQVRLYAATNGSLCVFRSTNGGWEEVNRDFPGLSFGFLTGSTEHPERVFGAAGRDGLYATEDGGKRWTRLFEEHVTSVALDPTNENVIYAGTEPIRLYRSEDRGESWEELATLQDFPEDVRLTWWGPNPPHVGHVAWIFIHPEDANTIYLCLEHGGVVRSFDRGASWEDVTQGIDYPDMHVLRALPGSRSQYFVSSARAFLASDDPARGWERAENGFTRDYFHDFIFLPPGAEGESPTMLVATADKSPGYWYRPEAARTAIFRSDDCAASWRRVGAGLPEEMRAWVSTLEAHPTDPDSAFAGVAEVTRSLEHGTIYGEGAILATRDRGDSWEKLPIELSADFALWAAAD
jgi:photosystem II stability/assembly factor-like uncharacterized protein